MTIEPAPLHHTEVEKIRHSLASDGFETLLECVRAERDELIIKSGTLRMQAGGTDIENKFANQASHFEAKATEFENFLNMVDQFRSGEYNFKRIIIKQ